MLWALGVTTAPRKIPTLEDCLVSLGEAGWPSPRLFAEPDCSLPDSCDALPVTRRDEPLGAFPNWYLGLVELVVRSPRADAYFLCQDDVILSRGLRPYLERTLWPAKNAGVVSLFCPSHYGRGAAVGFHAEDRRWDTWGAQAYLFTPDSARLFLNSGRGLEHLIGGPYGGRMNIDSVVGQWCHDAGRPYFVHVPSLAQHVGVTSTLHGGASTFGRRRAVDFIDDVVWLEDLRQIPAVNRE